MDKKFDHELETLYDSVLMSRTLLYPVFCQNALKLSYKGKQITLSLVRSTFLEYYSLGHVYADTSFNSFSLQRSDASFLPYDEYLKL